MLLHKAFVRSLGKQKLSTDFLPVKGIVLELFVPEMSVQQISVGLPLADESTSTSPTSTSNRNTNSLEMPKSGRSFRETFSLSAANLSIKDGSTPFSATVVHPGVMPESADPNGLPSISSLLKLTSFARIYAMHTPIGDTGKTFLEYDKLTKDVFTFVSSSLVEISPAMYDSAVFKCPLEVKMEGGHVGRTSVSTVSTVISPSDPKQRELMKQVNQVVLVSKETRRPVPVDDKWRDTYGPHCIRGEPLIIKAQTIPESGPLSVYEVKIAWSDTDNYKHTNFTSYPRFALDAVYDALKQGRLHGHLTEADFSSGLFQVKMAYIGETLEGDILKVHVWCPESSDRTCVCSMEKEGQTVNQVTLTFLPGSNVSSKNENL